MSVVDRIRRASVRFVLAPDGVAYRLRRVRSADLAEHAVVELVGGLEVYQETQRIKREQEEEARKWRMEHTDPKERERAEERAKEQAEHNAMADRVAMARVFSRNPKLVKGWAERVDAYVCAGVTGAVLPEEGADPDGLEYEPIRFVMGEADEDPEEGVVWVGHIDQQTRQYLADQVSDLSGAPTVAPFRGEP